MADINKNTPPQILPNSSDWDRQVKENYWTTKIEPFDPKTFDLKIQSRRAGGYSIAHVSVDPHIIKREIEHVRRDEIADVLVVMPIKGTCIVGYGKEHIPISTSSMCVFSGWEPYFLRIDKRSELVTFQMPCSALEARTKVKTNKLTFNAINTENGIPKVAANFLKEAFKQLDHIPRGQDRILFNNLASVICSGIQSMPEKEVTRSAYHEQLLRRIRRYIEDNIEDETLNANIIAEQHNVSVRYLNKLFEAESDTAIKYMRSLRLRLFAQRIITDTSKAVTIKEIVFGCGFSDYAHFHRVFKQYFQCTPNEYRNRHQSS